MSYNFSYDPLILFQFRWNFINLLLLYNLIRPPQPQSISMKLKQRITFRYSLEIYIVNMRNTACFDTIQPLIYHLCTALKPILCILCHITSYTTPSASLNFDQSSSTYYVWTQLRNKHNQYEAHGLLRCNPAPYIPPLYSFKANSMHFTSCNFLYDPASLFQFRLNFFNVLHIDTVLK